MVSDKLLQAEGGPAWEKKLPGGPGFSSGESHVHEFYLKELDEVLIVKTAEKSPHALVSTDTTVEVTLLLLGDGPSPEFPVSLLW